MRRLLWFFGIVYVVEGFGQTGGLIDQPLNYYLKQVQGWTPVQVTAYLTIFNLPWIIKPIYGLVSDFIPLFGYRRRTYLVLVNLLAALAYAGTAIVTQPDMLALLILLTAYGMAISSTLCGAILVESGQKLGASGIFVNQQWLWFNIASIIAALLGGALVEWLSPTAALHMAAAVVAVPPLAVVVGTQFLITEERATVNLEEMKRTFRSLIAVFRKKELWFVSFFLFFFYFNPGFNTPMYYHMTDNLKFSQAYIGILSSISAAGWVTGALMYQRFLEGMSSKSLLNLSIAAGTLATAAFVLLTNETTAAILNFCNGFGAMLGTVASLTLAADFCPKRSEGFAFAVMMAITNLSSSLADNVGSLLYEHVFDNNLTPLILVSAAFTALAFVLVPLLRLGDKPQGEPVGAVRLGPGEA